VKTQPGMVILYVTSTLSLCESCTSALATPGLYDQTIILETMKIVFWVAAPYSLVEVRGCLRGACA
jgi:hypothetical protein